MIIFDMREPPPKEGDEGIFQIGAHGLAYMMVERYSSLVEGGDDTLVMMDALGRIYDAKEYVAWIPSSKLVKLSRQANPLPLDKLDSIMPNDDITTTPVVLFSESPQEDGFRDYLEAHIARSRIQFNASLIAALDFHFGDEIEALRVEGSLESKVSDIVTKFLSEGFDYFCQVKMVEFNA